MTNCWIRTWKTVSARRLFRLSEKLATKLKETGLPSLPLDDDPYVDWSAHLFTADRTQYIIVTNTKSLYSVVMLGNGITDYSDFISRALTTLRDFMEDDGQRFVYQRIIVPASRDVRFAKDRSVTGSITELVKCAKTWLDDVSPHEVGFKLNEVPLSALSFGMPKEAFKLLVEGARGGLTRQIGNAIGVVGKCPFAANN